MPGEFDLGFPPHAPNLGRIANVVSEAGTTLDQFHGMALYEPVTHIMQATDAYSALSRKALRAPLKTVSAAMDHATALASTALVAPSEVIQAAALALPGTEDVTTEAQSAQRIQEIVHPVLPPPVRTPAGVPGGQPLLPPGSHGIPHPIPRGHKPRPPQGGAPPQGGPLPSAPPLPPGLPPVPLELWWGYCLASLDPKPIISTVLAANRQEASNLINQSPQPGYTIAYLSSIGFTNQADALADATSHCIGTPQPPPPPPPTPPECPPCPPPTPPPPTPTTSAGCVESADWGWAMDDCSDADISNAYTKIGIDPSQLANGQTLTDWWNANVAWPDNPVKDRPPTTLSGVP